MLEIKSLSFRKTFRYSVSYTYQFADGPSFLSFNDKPLFNYLSSISSKAKQGSIILSGISLLDAREYNLFFYHVSLQNSNCISIVFVRPKQNKSTFSPSEQLTGCFQKLSEKKTSQVKGEEKNLFSILNDLRPCYCLIDQNKIKQKNLYIDLYRLAVSCHFPVIFLGKKESSD